MMNFTNLEHFKDPIRYKMDVLKDGEIGGFCKLVYLSMMIESRVFPLY